MQELNAPGAAEKESLPEDSAIQHSKKYDWVTDKDVSVHSGRKRYGWLTDEKVKKRAAEHVSVPLQCLCRQCD